MKKQILITGGFGYLGGRIAVELAYVPGWKIWLGSRTERSVPDCLPHGETVVMDVLDPDSLPAAMRDVQAVIHLAAINENDCVADPHHAVIVNSLGTLNTLQVAIAAGVERFIYFSTAHVYGSPLIGNISEQTLPRPIHPYAITHRAAEDFVLAEHNQMKICGIVVRLSNGFGAPTHPDVDRWTLLVNDLCCQAVQNRTLVLRSSGLQQRDFIALTDVGRAVAHLLSLPREDCGDGLFNLGGETSLSIWQMAQRIANRCQAVLGFTPEIIRPEPVGEEVDPSLNYNMDKIIKTGFHLTGNIDQEIDNTLLFCKKFFGLKR